MQCIGVPHKTKMRRKSWRIVTTPGDISGPNALKATHVTAKGKLNVNDRAVTSGYAGYAARTGPPCLDATEGPPCYFTYLPIDK